MNTIEVLSYPLADITYDEVVFSIQKRLTEPGFTYIITLNPEILIRADQDPEVSAIIKNAFLCLADGSGLILASRFLYKKAPSKITGMDLTTMLLEKGSFSFYLVGGHPDILPKAVEVIAKDYPKSVIKGSQHGYFKPEEEAAIIADIQAKKPDIVLVGLGFPKQERFLKSLETQLTYGVGMGVGGVFDILSGSKPRAPEIWQKLHVEWLYRGLIEPQRMKRWTFIPTFGVAVMKEWISGRR